MTLQYTLALSEMFAVKILKKQLQQKPDYVARVFLRVIHRAARNVGRTGYQLAMGNVAGKGFPVKGTGSQDQSSLPGCKGAPNDWDGSVGLAETDALLLRLQLVFENDRRLIATAFRTGDL